jgi:hypothetical protein
MRARLTFWEASFRAFGHEGFQKPGPLIEAIGEMNLCKFVDGYELPEARRLPQLFDWFSRQVGALVPHSSSKY